MCPKKFFREKENEMDQNSILMKKGGALEKAQVKAVI